MKSRGRVGVLMISVPVLAFAVGGVSLVTNYRDEFNEQVKSGGIDGLIRALVAKNKGPAPK